MYLCFDYLKHKYNQLIFYQTTFKKLTDTHFLVSSWLKSNEANNENKGTCITEEVIAS